MGVQEALNQQAQLLQMAGYIDALKAFTRRSFVSKDPAFLPRPTRALCLGLGSLSDTRYSITRSASQLAAFQSILSSLDISPNNVRMHDPCFTDEDREFLRGLGYGLPQNAEEARIDLIYETPTLVFAPYLPYPVIELLFERNWTPERLKNVIMVATHLEGWLDDDNWFRSQEKAFIPRIRKSIPLFDVVDLPEMSTSAGEARDHHRELAIEELKLQWIPPKRMSLLGERFWHIRKLEDSTWAVPKKKELESKEPVKAKL